MKTKLHLFIASLLLTTMTSAASARGTSSKLNIFNDGSVVKIVYKSETTSNVTVSIFNNQNKQVFTEILSGKRYFQRRYNLEDFPLGIYILEVSDQSGTIRTEISTKATLHDERTFHIVPLRNEKNKYLLSIGKKDDTRIYVEIRDGQDNVIYSKNYRADQDKAEVLRFDRMKGACKIVIRDSNGMEKVYPIEAAQ